jgi:hypothetical protein
MFQKPPFSFQISKIFKFNYSVNKTIMDNSIIIPGFLRQVIVSFTPFLLVALHAKGGAYVFV